ncbi:hypothetical protein [Sphingomonas sp. LR60]|uniref:hypothetical protein n=1 Tax=Sphingomonas sp. LR60 TaxID=3050233 RepID=UPI002FE0A49C
MTAETESRPAPAVPDSVPVVFEAIVKLQAIAAMYNRGSVTLAPHILYTKHGEIYLDALTLERDGVPPRSRRSALSNWPDFRRSGSRRGASSPANCSSQAKSAMPG